MATLSLIPEERRKNFPNISSKSMESLYSTSSSKYSISMLHRRKNLLQPKMIPPSEIRQRVISARIHRVKNLQNQLTDAHKQISELTIENRTLRTLHKRQDSALSKYESTNAELPQLINSHAEEIRIWQLKYKNLQLQNRELSFKLKQKDQTLLAYSDQNKHLLQLNKDKNLEEREKLTEKLKELEARLIDKDNEYKLLSRRLQLDTKTLKTQINAEHHKYKEIYIKLEKANAEVKRVSDILESIERNNKLNSFSRSYGSSGTIKSMRPRDQKLILSTSTLLNGEMNNKSGGSIFSGMNNLNSLYTEKPPYSFAETVENLQITSSSERTLKLEKHEFSIKPTRNLLLQQQKQREIQSLFKESPHEKNDNDSNDSDFESKSIKSKNSSKKSNENLAFMIKNRMDDALNEVYSTTNSSSRQDTDDPLTDNEGNYSSEKFEESTHNGISYNQNEEDKDDEEEEEEEEESQEIKTNGHIYQNGNPQELISSRLSDDLEVHKTISSTTINVTNNDLRINKISSSSSSSETMSPYHRHVTVKKDNKTIEKIQNDIKNDLYKNENILDKFCDEFTKGSDIILENGTPPTIKKQLKNVELNLKNTKLLKNNYEYTNRKAATATIDPKKKSKLLAALKAIDSNESFDS